MSRFFYCIIVLINAPLWAMEVQMGITDEDCLLPGKVLGNSKGCPSRVRKQKQVSRIDGTMLGKNLMDLFNQCSPLKIVYDFEDKDSEDVRLNNNQDRANRAKDINRCISFIENFENCDPSLIAQALIKTTYDPIGLMCHVAKQKPNLSHKSGVLIYSEDIIRSLFAEGAELTKVPDYGAMARKKNFEPLTYNGLPAIVPELPETVQLTTILPKGFIEKKRSVGSDLSDCCAKNDTTTCRGQLLLEPHLLEKIASYCEPAAFRALMLSCKKNYAVLVNNVYTKIPVPCIPRRILDCMPCDLIFAEGMTPADLKSVLSDGFSKNWPNSGLAIDFSGFKGPIDVDLIDVIAQYPVISIQLCSNELPQGLDPIKKLLRLRDLWIRNCSLQSFPDKLCSLKELEALHIENCGMSNLPHQIGQLKRLKFLDIRNNSLSSLPSQLGELNQLRSLIVSGNPLIELPETLNNLKELRNLVFDAHPGRASGCFRLPSQLYGLQKLECLIIENQGTMIFPEGFEQLANLKELRVPGNNLEKIELKFESFQKLRYLDVSNNNLQSVPRELSVCKNLRYLNLSGNRILYFPKSLSRCPLRSFLTVENNPSSRFSRGLLLELAKKSLKRCSFVDLYSDDVAFLKNVERLKIYCGERLIKIKQLKFFERCICGAQEGVEDVQDLDSCWVEKVRQSFRSYRFNPDEKIIMLEYIKVLEALKLYKIDANNLSMLINVLRKRSFGNLKDFIEWINTGSRGAFNF